MSDARRDWGRELCAVAITALSVFPSPPVVMLRDGDGIEPSDPPEGMSDLVFVIAEIDDDVQILLWAGLDADGAERFAVEMRMDYGGPTVIELDTPVEGRAAKISFIGAVFREIGERAARSAEARFAMMSEYAAQALYDALPGGDGLAWHLQSQQVRDRMVVCARSVMRRMVSWLSVA